MGNKGPIRSKQSAHGGARVGVSGAGVSCATKGEAFQRTIISIIILIVIMSNTSIGSPIIISISLTIIISIIVISITSILTIIMITNIMANRHHGCKCSVCTRCASVERRCVGGMM